MSDWACVTCVALLAVLSITGAALELAKWRTRLALERERRMPPPAPRPRVTPPPTFSSTSRRTLTVTENGRKVVDMVNDEHAPLVTPPPKEPPATETLYPCSKCGKTRTKAEGGTTFAVCDECWDAVYGTDTTGEPEDD